MNGTLLAQAGRQAGLILMAASMLACARADEPAATSDAVSSAHEALSVEPPRSPDPDPPPEWGPVGVLVDDEAAPRAAGPTGEARVAEVFDTTIVAVRAHETDLIWADPTGVLDVEVVEVLRGSGLARGDRVAIAKPEGPRGTDCPCSEPTVREGESYVFALVHADRGWETAYTDVTGWAWGELARDATDPRGGAARFGRGPAIHVDLLREASR